jgi:NADPH:quinone reductase-like Zn-dependent oxidoreductase
LAVKPAAVSFEEAAGATLSALTAWQALVTFGTVHEGHKVLIHAAAGGVGHYAVQIAKFFGAYVIGTASSKNKKFVLDLGADEFIDYTKEKFEDRVTDADMILDSINDRDHLLRSMHALKNGGRLISIKSYFDEELKVLAKEKQLFTERILVNSDGYDMEQIALLMEKGLLKSHISKVYSFDELPKAHIQIETGKTRGKIVVKV